jgi:hypothetical protein
MKFSGFRHLSGKRYCFVNINLNSSIYPIEHIQLIAEEFCNKLSLQIIEVKATAYTIELQAKGQDFETAKIAGSFLNRLLEKSITEKFE